MEEIWFRMIELVLLIALAYLGKDDLKNRRAIKGAVKWFQTLSDATEDKEVTEEEWEKIWVQSKTGIEEATGKSILPPEIKDMVDPDELINEITGDDNE